MIYFIASVYIVDMFSDAFLKYIGINIEGFEILYYYCVLFVLFLRCVGDGTIVLNLRYVYLVLFVVVMMGLNYGMYYYVPMKEYFFGGLINLMIPFTFIVFYNIKVDKGYVIKVINVLCNLYFFTILLQVLLFFILNKENVLLKHTGYVAACSGMGLIMALFLYKLKGKKIYLFYMFFYLASIVFFLAIKTFILSAVIVLIYLIFEAKRLTYSKIMYVSVIFALFFFLPDNFVNHMIYKVERNIIGEAIDDTPRNMAYIAAYEMAVEYFPFGVGQSSYGSLYAVKKYSEVYSDYGFDDKWGFGGEKRQPKSAGFMLDTYWSSIIGEMGFLCGFIYVLIFLYPIFMLYRNRNDYVKDPFIFFVVTVVLYVFIGSIYQAMPYRISFVVFISGFSAFVLRIYGKKS